jgi:cytosine deaminase
MSESDADRKCLRSAYQQGLACHNEGGLPIGAVMVENGVIIAAGRNRRVQDRDPIAHGEMDCFPKAGRRARDDGITLHTILSPCMMCAGSVVPFGLRRVVVGESRIFPETLTSRGSTAWRCG